MIQLLDKNGVPVKLNIKAAALIVAIALGGFTGGATFPELSPLNLMSSECEAK
jgi:hypothetical protein